MAEVTPPRSVLSERIVAKTFEGLSVHKITPASPIAMFDSGVGGLSVFKEAVKQLPGEDIIYFGDTARVPYGGRSPQEIVKFNYEIISFLVSLGAKMVIMACGTSSAVAYPVVKDRYKIPIIPLVKPGAKAAVAASESGKIGLIATEATVDSNAYQRAIKKIQKNAQVFAAACPLFVPLVEGGFLEAEETKKIAVQYLKPLIKAEIDTLILGCTHYSHLLKILREITGIKIKFIDPAEQAVFEAKKILKDRGLASQRFSTGSKTNYQFFVSGQAAVFGDIGSKLLGRPLINVDRTALPKTGRGQG